MKKLLLGLGTAMTIVTPIVGLVSCSTDEDGNNRTKYPGEKEFILKLNHSMLDVREKQKIIEELSNLSKDDTKAREELAEIIKKYTPEIDAAQAKTNIQQPQGQTIQHPKGQTIQRPQGQTIQQSQAQTANSKLDFSKYHLMSPLQHQKLSSVGRTELHHYYAFKVSNNTLNLIKELRNMRTAYGRGWAPIGDSVVDAINDVRFITFQQHKGNNAPRLKFKEIVASSESMTGDLKEEQSNGTLRNSIAHSMTNFLDLGDLSDKGLAFSKQGTLAGQSINAIHAWATESDIDDMKPVVPTIRDMAWAQYRANQVEFVGDVDPNGNSNPHDWKGLNAEIAAGKTSTSGGIANAPKILKGSSSENLGNYVRVTIDGKDQLNKLSEITTLEAYSLMWGFFIDIYDATGTVGHRGNLLNTRARTVGWSEGITLDNNNVKGYTLTGYYEFNAAPPSNDVKASKIDLSWLAGGMLGFMDADFVRSNLDYSKLPSDIDTWTHQQILDALNGVKKDDAHFAIVQDGNSRPVSGEHFALTDNGKLPVAISAAQKAFDALPNSQIDLGNVDSTITPTHVYDILGSSTQAEYESK